MRHLTVMLVMSCVIAALLVGCGSKRGSEEEPKAKAAAGAPGGAQSKFEALKADKGGP